MYKLENFFMLVWSRPCPVLFVTFSFINKWYLWEDSVCSEKGVFLSFILLWGHGVCSEKGVVLSFILLFQMTHCSCVYLMFFLLFDVLDFLFFFLFLNWACFFQLSSCCVIRRFCFLWLLLILLYLCVSFFIE